MSEYTAFEHDRSPIRQDEADLLARLYHEIGLSAVAAALEILKAPAKPAQSQSAFETFSFARAEEQDSLAA